MEEKKNRFGIPESYARRIAAFRLFDDTFLSTVFDNSPKTTERMLRIILDRDDIEVIEVRAQTRLTNLVDREIVLDVLARERGGGLIDIEVQRDSTGAPPERARFNLALMDARSLAKGEPYTAMKENYVIFITEEDTLARGEPVSRIERMILGDGGSPAPFGDGSHIVYVNGAYVPPAGEENDLTRLIGDFHRTDPKEMQIREIAERVDFFKNTEGGQRQMCKIVEELVEEGKEQVMVESVKNLMDSLKIDAEQAMDLLKVPKEQRKKIAEKL
ncbi:MAG: PD-(D/E)XK nuclease family transposase [Clostridia bacterium]|nr:PD-(D/E)XK nuclease family transposase [Clostridia bacterium]